VRFAADGDPIDPIGILAEPGMLPAVASEGVFLAL
jgi:hypothetical protein